MTRDQLEFAISQYVDNTLSAVDRAALEDRLEQDAEARQLLAEYRGLDELFRRELPPTPELNWNDLANQISAAVAEEEIPVRTLRISWHATSLAMAASVLLALGIGFVVYKNSGMPHNVPNGPISIAKIDGPAAEPATQPALVKIELGPADQFADNQYQLSEPILSRPSSVRLIASQQDPAQDTPRSPYQQ